MPQFITIGYGDREGYEKTDPAVRNAAHESDAWLQRNGALLAIAGSPVQVRNHDGAAVKKQDGPFMRSDLPVAGFAVIEASDTDEALALASESPCAVAQGVVEVWPLEIPGTEGRSS